MKKALLAILVLAGCVTTEKVWIKDGASQQDFYAESGQCKAQAFSAPGMPMMQVAIVYASCMQGKGWHTEERSLESSGGAGQPNPTLPATLRKNSACDERCKYYMEQRDKCFAEDDPRPCLKKWPFPPPPE